MHPAGAGISTMSLMDGGAASSTAASQAPALAQYSMDTAENGLAGSLTRSAAGTESAVAGDKIIYTARLTLETKDYDTARAALEQALADAGGWMENSSESSYDDSSRSLSMTLRVPAENYESFLTAAGQAASLVNRSESADDVTAQYTDVAGRIANLEGQRDRLRELQASAGTLSDLLGHRGPAVRRPVPARKLAEPAWTGTTTRSLAAPSPSACARWRPTPPPARRSLERLGAAFAEGWQNFVAGLASIAVVLAGLWPVVVIVAAAVAAVVIVRIRRRR